MTVELQLTPPFGHRWNIAQRIRHVPPQEVVAAATELFAGGAADG